MMWMHKSETTGNCLIGTCLFVSGRELELELHLHAKELGDRLRRVSRS